MFDALRRLIYQWQDAPYILYMDTRFRVKNSFSHPLVTVGVPLYNEEKFLTDCLESIKRQTYRNWECIIVNDCSTDSSTQVAERLVAGDTRFRIVHHDVNKGLAASRNTALRHARGEYITFLDSDDFLFPSSLWQRVYALANNYEKDVAGSYTRIILGKESSRPRDYYPERYLSCPRTIDFITARGECPFNAHAPMLKTEIVRAFSGFNENMVYGAEDWDLWLRILRHGYKFIPSYGSGGVYRRKRSSMVKRFATQHVDEGIRLIERAFSNSNSEREVNDTPYYFAESLCYYEKAIMEARRIIGYAMLTYLANDEQGTRAILDRLDPSILFLMHHIALDWTLNKFIMRFYCLDEGTYNPNAKEYVQIKKEFSQKVMRHLEALSHGTEAV